MWGDGFPATELIILVIHLIIIFIVVVIVIVITGLLQLALNQWFMCTILKVEFLVGVNEQGLDLLVSAAICLTPHAGMILMDIVIIIIILWYIMAIVRLVGTDKSNNVVFLLVVIIIKNTTINLVIRRVG